MRSLLKRIAVLSSAFVLIMCANEEDLLKNHMIEGDAIPERLNDQVGEITRGKQVFSERGQGHCVLCHKVAVLDVPFQGNIGPDLSQIGRHLSEGQLRLRIADASRIYPGTVMPSYYRSGGFNQIEEAYEGQSILTAGQIEDLVAYLASLKGEEAL